MTKKMGELAEIGEAIWEAVSNIGVEELSAQISDSTEEIVNIAVEAFVEASPDNEPVDITRGRDPWAAVRAYVAFILED